MKKTRIGKRKGRAYKRQFFINYRKIKRNQQIKQKLDKKAKRKHLKKK